MKKILVNIAMSLMFVALVVSCANNENADNQVEEPKTETDTICSAPLIAMQDCQQQMSAELFAGQDDELLKKILPDGTAEASINVFMQERGDKIVLFDAGLGASHNGRLLANLDSVGVLPDEITDICITHFHGDHIGGLLSPEGEAVFKNAKLHFSDLELEAWTVGALKDKNEMVEKMLFAYEGRCETFQAGDTIVDGIVTIAAPGHTPGHTMYDIGDAIVVGDLMHAVALQVEHPEFSAAYDFDPALASETRKAMLEIARTSHKPLAGMHFPKPFIIEL
ncbi:MAG: MBL fold metallo-hydrolase [Bacteroidales bacterium]|nr:MBL fold metallo-hydrolase [Bacteroidales bacterium]